MTLTKKIISKKLSEDTPISLKDSKVFVDSFIEIIKNNSRNYHIKIHDFGSFLYKMTPKRIGRNPKTGKTYIIKAHKRLIFRASFKLKNFLN
jgi:nucleoid DNA-binding protein